MIKIKQRQTIQIFKLVSGKALEYKTEVCQITRL